MSNNFFKILWLGTDTFYRVFVRLLYHSKVVGVLVLFWGVIFVTSFSFFFSIYEDIQSSQKQINGNTQAIPAQGAQGFYTIDVGQGDSLLYITKENQTFLIDTGSPGDLIVQKLEKILGSFKKKIDVVLLTHPDSDHVGEIANILSSYNVGLLLYSPIYDVRPNSQKSIEVIKNKNKTTNKTVKDVTRVLPVFAGEKLSFSPTEEVLFLSPSYSGMTTFVNKKEIAEDNYFSVVSMIKNKDAIFTMADAPQKIEKVLSSSLVEPPKSRPYSDFKLDIFSQIEKLTGENFSRNQFDKIILKVGHHGSKTSSAPEFIEKLLPTDAVLSYGENNRYGHPNKEVLDIFEQYSPQTKIHRTISGTVYFSE